MEIPLFPLHTVLCPGIALPLHIFEERYRAMTRHCLDIGEPFGVVLIREGREVGPGAVATLAGVGAFAEIREAGRYADGRYDLLAAATGRFAIESVDAQKEPYLVAEVDALDDEVGDEPRAERLAAAATRRFVRYLDLMRPATARRGGARHPGRGREPATTTRTRTPSRGRRVEPELDDDGRRRRPADPPRPRRSRTTRPSCRTCSRASSRSSCRAARPCSRRRRPTSASRPHRRCSSARSSCSAAGCATSRRTRARSAEPRRS